MRDERFPDDDNVRWVVSDVRDFDAFEDADVVCCLGLWYHLTLDDQRRLARKIAPRPLVVDTHVATQVLPSYQRPNEQRLSPVVAEDGFIGRVYDERGLESRPTASWGNRLSFWPSVASLERQMYEAGYELFDQLSPPYLPDRAFFVADSWGDGEARERVESLVAKFNPVVRSDPRASERPLYSLAAAVEPEPVRPTQPRRASRSKPPTVKQASRQLADAVSRSVRFRLARIGRAG